MAFGSWRSASITVSNHPWNWAMGSGSRSALSRPALVYSLRRLEASTLYLPAPGAGGALERADNIRGDPTPVEVPFLRLDLLSPDPTSIHPVRIERHVVFEAGERRRRVGIEPRRLPLCPLFCSHVVVTGAPLPLAVRAPGRGLQKFHPHVLGRDVVHGRVARLEDALGPRSIGERDAAEDDLDLLVHVLDPRRTRIGPHGLLAWTGLYSLTVHKYLLACHPRLYGWKKCPCMHPFTPAGDPGPRRIPKPDAVLGRAPREEGV